jgi:hypothetical protein
MKRRRTYNKKTNKTKRRKSKKTRRMKGGVLDSNASALVSQSLQNRSTNFTNILKTYCKNPDNCLALGVYGDYIKTFFNNFRDINTDIDKTNLKKIGTPSANGFIIEIPFKKDGYTSYTALKCASEPHSDNLYYEYYVGKFFINNYLKKLSCFVETYDCYNFIDDAKWLRTYNEAQTNSIANAVMHLRIRRFYNIKEDDMNYFDMSCRVSVLMCVLIQHFDNFYSFNQKLSSTNINNMKYDYYYLWYQLYYSLVYLGNKYTHYDLHDGNVFLYKPYDGKQYILMKYHNGTNYFEFKSEYIVKIIDYGRNYFNNGKRTTKEIAEYICNSQHCQPYCGIDLGYASVATNMTNPSAWNWINPAEPNMSHDLRAVKKYSDTYLNDPDYSFGVPIEYQKSHGTPENLSTNPDKIYNIYQMKERLENIMASKPNYYDNKYDNTWTMAATMEIFDDGRDYIFNNL